MCASRWSLSKIKLLFVIHNLKLNKRAYTQYGETMHTRFMKRKVATLWSISVILLSVLQQVHSLFQSKFCTQHDVVLPLSIYSILTFP